jgi:hypothetical protein
MRKIVICIVSLSVLVTNTTSAFAQQAPNRGNENREIPNRDEPQIRDQSPDRDIERVPVVAAQTPINQTGPRPSPPNLSPSGQQIEKLSIATRSAIKALTVQIESLKARVAQLEALQQR